MYMYKNQRLRINIKAYAAFRLKIRKPLLFDADVKKRCIYKTAPPLYNKITLRDLGKNLCSAKDAYVKGFDDL